MVEAEYGNLFDRRAVFSVLGCLIKQPELLENYVLTEDDFESSELFYQIVFETIYNLYHQGVKIIDAPAIDSMISQYEKPYKIFQENQGFDYCATAKEQAELSNFKYYYDRVKKFSFLRFEEKRGVDTRIIYDTTLLDEQARNAELAKFDEMTIDDMLNLIDAQLIADARTTFGNTYSVRVLAGEGMKALKERLKEAPEIGIPLQSAVLSTVARGARKGKLYLRSSGTGGGKTRTGAADCCGFAIPERWDKKTNGWVKTGFCEPAVFISTELEIDEVQTMCMAHISGVDEEHILDGKYGTGEEERVDKAIELIENSPLYIEFLPDFGIQDVENIIKNYHSQYGVDYFCFDYVHMSAHLIMEVAKMSKGMKLREDQILFLFIDKLKALCNTLGIFILTMTQLNGTYKEATVKDESLLRGAKSMADRIDLGEISLPPTQSELDAIAPITMQDFVVTTPNLVRHIYKVRRNKLTRIKIWQKADLGTCTTEDLFVTDYDNQLINVDVMNITPEIIDRIIDEHSEDIDTTEVETEEDDEDEERDYSSAISF